MGYSNSTLQIWITLVSQGCQLAASWEQAPPVQHPTEIQGWWWWQRWYPTSLSYSKNLRKGYLNSQYLYYEYSQRYTSMLRKEKLCNILLILMALRNADVWIQMQLQLSLLLLPTIQIPSKGQHNRIFLHRIQQHLRAISTIDSSSLSTKYKVTLSTFARKKNHNGFVLNKRVFLKML